MFEALLKTVFEDIEHRQDISLESMKRLHLLFPNTLKAALELIESGCVTRVSTVNGCFYHMVRGQSTNVHVVMPDCCSCRSFATVVIEMRKEHVCKHILAVELARRIGGAEQSVVVGPDKWYSLLKGILWPEPA